MGSMIREKRGSLVSTDGGRLIFFLLTALLLLGVMAGMPRVSLPFGISYILVLILNPLLPHFKKIGLDKNLSIFVLFFLMSFCLIYPIIKIIPSIETESANLQYYVPKMESFLRGNYQGLQSEIKKRIGMDIGDKFLNDVILYGQAESKNLLLKLPNVVALLFEWMFLIPLFLFFLLKDGENFKYAFLRIVPNRIFEQTYFLFYKFNKQLGDYIFAKFVEASIVGIITTAGLLVLNVNFAFLLGGAAAVTNIVPYVGPFLGFIPAFVVGMVEYGAGPTMGAIIILYSIANIIDLAIIFPILVSKIVNLHPVTVVISVILGSQYMGILGMVISVPVAAIMKLIYVEIYRELNPTVNKSSG